MKRAVVTGAAGFAGCNLVEALLGNGYYVYAVVRPNSSHNSRLCNLDNLKIIECEMQDYDNLHNLIEEPCDTFYHLAWQAGDFEAQKQCIEYSLEALDAAARVGCRRFVCTGSQAEYGPQKKLITEETYPHPITAYGAAKLATCVLTKQKAYELGLEWTWGRIFSLYGKYEPRGRMLPDLVNSLREGRDFKLSAATQYWDYLYSSDGADALIAIGEKGHSGEIYNVANGDFHPLKFFIEEIREIITSRGNIFYGEELENATSLQVSVEKIKKDTGWSPRVDFRDGIKEIITL